MRISDWSSDVCSSDLIVAIALIEDVERRDALFAVALRERRERGLPLGHSVGAGEYLERQRGNIRHVGRGQIGERHPAQAAITLRPARKVGRGGCIAGNTSAPLIGTSVMWDPSGLIRFKYGFAR